METVLTGARIPKKLREETKKFCDKYGLKLSYFITEAITDKLQELKEEEEDIAIIKARENETTISLSEIEQYFKSRGISV